MGIVLSVNRSWIDDAYFSLYRPIHPGGKVRGKRPDTTARILYQSFTPKRHWQLCVEDLPKVPTWRLERESNPRESSTQPMRHHII